MPLRTDKVIDVVARCLFEHSPFYSGRDWDWCVKNVPTIANEWKECARAAIKAYKRAIASDAGG